MKSTPGCKPTRATSTTCIGTQPALWQRDFEAEGFRWIEANDADYSVYSYIRYAEDISDFLVVVLELHTGRARENYRIGVPERPAIIANCSTATPAATAAAMSAMPAVYIVMTFPLTACRTASTCACRPWRY